MHTGGDRMSHHLEEAVKQCPYCGLVVNTWERLNEHKRVCSKRPK